MSDIVKNAFANLDPNNEQFVNKNTSIVEEIYNLIESKGLSQKQFAAMLGKNESEVSKWLSGLHNLTLRSIAKMEVALEEDIILTCTEAKEKYAKVEYVLIQIDATKNSNSQFSEIEKTITFTRKENKPLLVA